MSLFHDMFPFGSVRVAPHEVSRPFPSTSIQPANLIQFRAVLFEMDKRLLIDRWDDHDSPCIRLRTAHDETKVQCLRVELRHEACVHLIFSVLLLDSAALYDWQLQFHLADEAEEAEDMPGVRRLTLTHLRNMSNRRLRDLA
jgi:hypothetical protein